MNARIIVSEIRNSYMLEELKDYIRSRYRLEGAHRFLNLPDLLVYVDKPTDKWLCVMYSKWDEYQGEMVEKLDLRCGQREKRKKDCSYITDPYFMNTGEWVGINISKVPDKEILFELFDEAIKLAEEDSTLIIIDNTKDNTDLTINHDTVIPAMPERKITQEEVPEKIKEMHRLDVINDWSVRESYHNFYVMGKYMEDYEDNKPWHGDFHMYYPTYHNLTDAQLRGYFTWRTGLRKGIYTRVPTSFAYIYIYELLNLIGIKDGDEAYHKLLEFEDNYLTDDKDDKRMRNNIGRWIYDLAIVYNLDLSIALKYQPKKDRDDDRDFLVLLHPSDHTDEEIFSSLDNLDKHHLKDSLLLKDNREQGVHLYAFIYKEVFKEMEQEKINLFAALFISSEIFYKPFMNAVFYQDQKRPDYSYKISEVREYRLKEGSYNERHYLTNRSFLDEFLHETERQLRRYKKTGHYLKKKEAGKEFETYIEKAILKEEVEERKPKISIDFSSLGTIRSDAALTRDSLLTESEIEEENEELKEESSKEDIKNVIKPSENSESESDSEESKEDIILKMLLADQDVSSFIKANHLLPSVIADKINEKYLDEIGDSVVEYDGKHLKLIEDYKDDLLKLSERK